MLVLKKIQTIFSIFSEHFITKPLLHYQSFKMALAGVTVSIEAVHENQIQEVTLDGQETYVP